VLGRDDGDMHTASAAARSAKSHVQLICEKLGAAAI
jgi:hypothetical protein